MLLFYARLAAKIIVGYFVIVFFAVGLAMLASALEGRALDTSLSRIEAAVVETAPIFFATFFVGIPVLVTLAIAALSALMVLMSRPKGELLSTLTAGGQSLLDYRVCNACIETAEPNQLFHSVMRAMGADKSANAQLDLIRRKAGGLWVGGRVFLTTDRIVFVPNALNAMLQDNVSAISFDVSEVVDVGQRSGLMTTLVDIRTCANVLTIRGYRMKAFGRAIQDARAGRMCAAHAT